MWHQEFTGDLRGTTASTSLAWLDRSSAATAKLSLVDDTTGGASLAAQSGAPLGEMNLLPGNSFRYGGAMAGDEPINTSVRYTNAGFDLTFGPNTGWTVMKATVDLADGDVSNGIANGWSNLFAFAAGTPSFLWVAPATISASPGNWIRMSQEGGVFSQFNTDGLLCGFQAFDTSDAGFSMYGKSYLRVPADIAAGDYPLTVAAQCSADGSPGTSEARINITLRVAE